MKSLKNYMDTSKIINLLRNKKIWAVVVACFLFLSICLFVFLYHLVTPLNKGGEEKIFIVKEGQGLEEIAENLRAERIIGNKWSFILYVWLQGKTKNLQAGKYSLSSSMNTAKVAQKIIKGEVIQNWIKITIPEGWTNKQIEEKLIELEIIIPEEYEFYRIATEDFAFLTDRPSEFSLEGYLFPDTYYFEPGTFVGDVVKKMLTNFGNKLTQDLREEIKRQGKTIFEVIIMASILEKEVITDEDRAIVSGIFWKRLGNNYPLESCATIAHILGVDKWRYSVEDTRIKSSYNTYLNIGLPPTPINNPGISAIRAAIYPQESDYYFFLTDPETGATIFSKTLEEHNINKRQYFE